MQKLPTKHNGSLNELTPIIIKNIRENPRFYEAVNNIIKNICIDKREYNEIKNYSNIKKLVELYSQSINYQKNLSNKFQNKKKQLQQRIQQKKKHNEIKRENVYQDRKIIAIKQEKVNKNIKVVAKCKQRIKNNRNNASMMNMKRNNSFNSANTTAVWPNQFNDIRNMRNDYYMHQPLSDKVPTKKQRKCSCSQNIQKNGIFFGNQYNQIYNRQKIPEDSYKIQQHIQILPQNNLSTSNASQKFKNQMRRSIQQSKIAINTKELLISLQQSNVKINTKEIQLTQMRNNSPINITTSLDDSFDKNNIKPQKYKPQKDEQISTVKKGQKLQKLSYNYKDSMIYKNLKFQNQSTAKLRTPPRLQNNDSKYEQADLSTQKQKRSESPIQLGDAFDQLQEQSIVKKTSDMKPRKLVGKRISNPTIDSRIAFKNGLNKKPNKPTLGESLQLAQSLTTSLKDFREFERPTNQVKFNSNNYIQEQSDKSEDLRSTVNDNNIRKKMIELIREYQLTLTTRQNLSAIEKEIQQSYTVSKGWKQQIEFWRGIIQRFGGVGKKKMKIYLSDLGESLALINSGIGSRVNDLKGSQRSNNTNERQRRATQDRIYSSQRGNQ